MSKRARAVGRRTVSGRAAARPTETAEHSRTGLLAGIVGHELNNISVPLKGFADLALHTGRLSKAARQCLDEIAIAIERVRRLACELEGYSESESSSAYIPICACMPNSDPEAHGKWRMNWMCDPASLVCADALHARRAIESLAAATAQRGLSPPHATELTVSHLVNVPAACVACDARLTVKANNVQVHSRSARSIARETLRDPFGPKSVSRGIRRLSFAVLVHCAHRAGGHLLLDETCTTLSVTFPTA